MSAIGRQFRQRRGFTLVEMLVVTVLVAGLLTVMAFHIYTISQTWLKRNEGRFLPAHADGVTYYLRELFAQADVDQDEPRLTPPEGVEELPEEAIAFDLPPQWFGSESEPMLAVYQHHPGPLLQTAERPSPEVQSYLYYDDREQQLSLIWFGLLEPELTNQRDLHHTVISSYVRTLEYVYYDEETDEWEVEDEPMEVDAAFPLPRYLKLTFGRGEQTTVRYVPFPLKTGDPVY